MTTNPSDFHRRNLLQVSATAGLAVLSQFSLNTATATPANPAARGASGDFDFLSGNWTIQHRRMKDNNWDTFDGEATVVSMLGGVASVEELRVPARKFSGMGLRLLNVERKQWADYWVNASSGVLSAEPAWGGFTDGVGTWDAHDVEDGHPIIVRGVWDLITPRSCRWYQTVSRDGGKRWEKNWVMHWLRVGP